MDARPTPSRRRFSRVRMIVTIVIAGIVLTIGTPFAITLIAPRLLVNLGRTNQKVAATEAKQIAQQVQLYLADNGLTKPPAGMTLSVLTQGSTPYLKPADLLDPWGRPYVLIVPGRGIAIFNIVSYGREGMPGGEGADADIIK